MSGLISVDEALAIIANARPQIDTETVTLADALGATLAEPVVARLNRPPAAVSAMDGYAVRLVDVTTAGAALTVIGEAPAGTRFDGSVNAGEAVRIFTGGEIPAGADHIVIQEDTSRDGDTATCTLAYDRAAFVRAKGLDFSDGQTLIAAGTRIGAAELAVAAAANHAELSILRRPRVALLANGDELKQPGSAVSDGQIINSNPAGLSALIREWGGVPVDLGIAADTLDDIKAHIDHASDADIIVPVGGASVGNHDYMRPAFAEAGFELVFEKIAVKPGKPTWLAKRGKQIVLGLPGNPASALVCAHLFLKPLVQPRQSLATIAASVGAELKENGPRESFLRGVCEWQPDGTLQAKALRNQDSSLLTPFLEANCLIRRKPHAPAISAGGAVPIILLKSLDA